jgi:hypothetical protein
MALFHKALSRNNKERANGTTLFGVKRLNDQGEEEYLRKVFSYPDIAVDAMLNAIERKFNNSIKRNDPKFKYIFTEAQAIAHREEIVKRLQESGQKEFSYTILYNQPNGTESAEYFKIFPVSLHCDPYNIPQRM